MNKLLAAIALSAIPCLGDISRSTELQDVPVNTHLSAIADLADIPAWAKEPNPPASMPSYGIVWSNNVVQTADGTTKTIGAAEVGALPTSGGTIAGSLEIKGNWDFGGARVQIKNALISEEELDPAVVEIGDAPYGILRVGGEIAVHGTNVMDAISAKMDTSERASILNDAESISAEIVGPISNKVEQWTTYWDGDDVRVTVTNYYGSADMPHLYLEQKMPADETHDAAWFKTVWDETTRWNAFIPNFNYVSNALVDKADRAWGFYDSHTGNYAPDGYTWVSSPKIAISGGMAYQRFATSEGAVWVLESNGLVTETGGETTNGFFRIADDEGNTMFSIRKGDKRTVGATCGSIRTESVMGITHVYCDYNVESADHPTISTTIDLSSPDWKDETDGDSVANVTWTGYSGAWHAEVWGKTALNSMFIRAKYEVGGETLIENTAPVQMNSIYVGGQKYTLGTAVISGNTVLTLTPAN